MLNLKKYRHNPDSSKWLWNLATLEDVEPIVSLCETHFQREIDSAFVPDRHHYAYNVTQAIVNQHYNATKEQLICAKLRDGTLIAYAWISVSSVIYSQTPCVEAKMIHMDLTLSARERITLLVQILTEWEQWCKVCGHCVIISTTIREEHDVFLKVHKELGYTLRGAICYKRVK